MCFCLILSVIVEKYVIWIWYSEMRHRLDFPARDDTGGDGVIVCRQIFSLCHPCRVQTDELCTLPSAEWESLAFSSGCCVRFYLFSVIYFCVSCCNGALSGSRVCIIPTTRPLSRLLPSWAASTWSWTIGWQSTRWSSTLWRDLISIQRYAAPGKQCSCWAFTHFIYLPEAKTNLRLIRAHLL